MVSRHPNIYSEKSISLKIFYNVYYPYLSISTQSCSILCVFQTTPVMHIIAGDQRQTEVDNWESGEVFAIGVSRDQYSSGLTKDWIPLCRKGKSKFIVS